MKSKLDLKDEPRPKAGKLSRKDKEVFDRVNSFMERGGVFLGNHYETKEKTFIIKIAFDGSIIKISSRRCYEFFFDPKGNRF